MTLGRFVGLVETSAHGVSVALLRGRAWPFLWMARLSVLSVEHGETSRGLHCTSRIVSPARADELGRAYWDWLVEKTAPKQSFSKQLDKHWRERRKAQLPKSGRPEFIV